MTSTITFPPSQVYSSQPTKAQNSRGAAQPSIDHERPTKPVEFFGVDIGKRNSRWHRLQKKIKNKFLDLYEDSRDWFKEFFSIIYSDVKNFCQWVTRKLH